MAQDPGLDAVVLFGGFAQYPYSTSNGTRIEGVTESDTWLYSYGTWTNITSTVGTAPPARFGAGMTYDPQQLDGNLLGPVLFGGTEQYPVSGERNDTWALESGVWVNLTHGVAPPQNTGMGFTYVTGSSAIILVCGSAYDSRISGSIQTNATWMFSNGSWTQLSPPVLPVPSWDVSFADDPSNGDAILVLGSSQDVLAGVYPDWIFSQGNWTVLGTSTTVPPAGSATMIFDAADQEVVLVSPGYVGSSTGKELTWAFKDGNWSKVNSTTAPPASLQPALVYDAADGYVLQVGGEGVDSGLGLNESWEFKSGEWTQLFPSRSPPPTGMGAIAYDANPGYVLYFTGDETWQWLSGDWTELNLTNQPYFENSESPYPRMVYDAGY